ncbi:MULTISPECIES: Rha family transcriptional regulator [Companilactobacillus]|uniref:Rha family transcriptional regulator n=1 Tax=Companilactobacillus TaxID=2767879 RepID=UPI00138F2ACD|nr:MULTISPECIES: Rha family transcriptional regulator [Companilactobacillus]
MKKLVFVNNALISAKPFTTSEILAKQMHISEETVMHRITQYKDRLEHFGKIEFSSIIDGNPKGGRPKKIVQLTEPQATLLITFFKNTKVVADFKEELVKQFYDMKRELTKREVYKELEKPVRRSLTDTIKEWEYSNQWSYKAITDLICKTITGKSTKQLKKARKIDNPAVATDIYTSDELAEYQKLETKVITLIDLGMTYKDIKAVLSGQPLNIELKAKKSVKKDLLSRPKLSKPSK